MAGARACSPAFQFCRSFVVAAASLALSPLLELSGSVGCVTAVWTREDATPLGVLFQNCQASLAAVPSEITASTFVPTSKASSHWLRYPIRRGSLLVAAFTLPYTLYRNVFTST